MISRTILDADCVINLPKLKTHKKTGVTLCMKNLVGINGNKNWLPHHRLGTPAQGGDQFADDSVKHRIERKTMECFQKNISQTWIDEESIGKTNKICWYGYIR